MSKHQPLEQLRDEKEEHGTPLLSIPYGKNSIIVLWRNDKTVKDFSVLVYEKWGENWW